VKNIPLKGSDGMEFIATLLVSCACLSYPLGSTVDIIYYR